MAQGFSLADQLFNPTSVGELVDRFARAGLDTGGLAHDMCARLPGLELKQRIAMIADLLAARLPGDLPDAAPVLLAALPPPLDPTLRDDDFGSFIHAPLGEVVVTMGLDRHPELSLDLLEEITQRFSMEYAIRPFLNRWPDLVLARMQGWARHPNYHVRRLVSEGTRPRLPWGIGISMDISRPLALLDTLHCDQARFVTRSVANHLNDIAKKAPDIVLDRLSAWRKAGRQNGPELDWMTSHATRGLVKAGHPGALAMLGYDAAADLTCALTLEERTVRIGTALEFTCEIRSDQDWPVLVDYVLHFASASGAPRRKVFKLKQAATQAGTPLVLTKRHPLKGDATTFRLVPGAHRIEVQVNGQVRAGADFDLRT